MILLLIKSKRKNTAVCQTPSPLQTVCTPFNTNLSLVRATGPNLMTMVSLQSPSHKSWQNAVPVLSPFKMKWSRPWELGLEDAVFLYRYDTLSTQNIHKHATSSSAAPGKQANKGMVRSWFQFLWYTTIKRSVTALSSCNSFCTECCAVEIWCAVTTYRKVYIYSC